MDILYLVGKKSTCNFEDLRYSLRSLESYGRNLDRVFICGHCPDWVSSNVIKIEVPVKDSLNNNDKNKNIYKDLLYAVEHTDIGVNHKGEFLLSMDDHFLCREVDLNNYPIYIKDYIKRKCRHMLPLEFEPGFPCPEYQNLLVSTANFLKNKGLTYVNFTLHRNMHMNRYLLLKEMKDINSEIFSNNDIFVEGAAVALNWRYSKHPFDCIITKDIKSNNVYRLTQYIKLGGHCFSTDDFELNSPIHKFLQRIYPKVSIYETAI